MKYQVLLGRRKDNNVDQMCENCANLSRSLKQLANKVEHYGKTTRYLFITKDLELAREAQENALNFFKKYHPEFDDIECPISVISDNTNQNR